VKKFAASATDGNGHFLRMMNPSPLSLDSSRSQTTERFERKMPAGRIQSSSRDEHWLSADRIANCTLFCDDVVYLDGGQPAFYGISYSRYRHPELSLEIASLKRHENEIVASWLPGPETSQLQEAACRSLVFRIEDLENEATSLERRGFHLELDARTAVCMKVEAEFDPSEVCVDALVRRALKWIDRETAHELREAMSDEPLPVANYIMNRSICRDALHKMVSMCPPELTPTIFGFEFEWVEKALRRLDARFPPC
jgi:hypothetical protein